LAIAVTCCASVANGQAWAEPVCGPREPLLRELAKTYGETPTGNGLTREGALLEVLASERGTWTVMLSSPDGRACILAAGERWRGMPVTAIPRTH